MSRKDPFRTLDDKVPDAPPIAAEEITAGTLTAGRIAADASLGYWAVAAARPGWLRRLIVWLLLGWKWNASPN